MGLILITHYVMIPKLPSWPRINSWISGPELILGAFWFFWMVPMGVAILIPMTISSMFPYLFFFIPLARVLTHPPRDENSIESGSWPQQTPNLDNYFSRSFPMIPASTLAIILLRSTHLILFIRVISTETIVLFSVSRNSNDSVTFVPPPKGIKTMLYFFASLIKF